MRPAVPHLHLVTDDAVIARPDFAARLAGVARKGIAIHARAPHASGRELFRLAGLVTDAARKGGALSLVNDRADVAVAVDADGVHAPERGLPVAAIRRIIGPDRLTGRSVHSAEDARRAADEGADYIFLGPVWETRSHPGRSPLGLEALRELGHLPIIAIGGVTAARARACRDAGAWGVATISAVWQAEDPGTVVQQMLVNLGV